MQKHELTQEWIVERLMKRAIAPEVMAKYIRSNEDGSLEWDFSRITPEDKELIDLQMETTKGGESLVKKMKLALRDSDKAIEQLMKIMGIGKEQVEAKVTIESVDPTELARRVAFLLTRGKE